MRASEVLPAGTWNAADQIDEVLIDQDRRQRRRLMMATQSGRGLLLDLARPVRLRNGDGLLLEDGDVVRVLVPPETLLEIRSGDLTRLAWHLGNRHLEVEVRPDCLRIRADHVIEAMLRGLGASVVAIEDAFEPEPGAYSATEHV